MTGRATFGDFALAVTRHIEAAASVEPPALRPNPSTAASEVHEFTYAVQRVVKVMDRYVADISTSLAGQSGGQSLDVGPWARAIADSRAALQNARRCLPVLANRISMRVEPQLTSSVSRGLDQAATSLAAARDLLQTHFATEPDGTRKPKSEWAPLISSKLVGQALMTELGRWAGQIAAETVHLTYQSVRYGLPMEADHQRLIAMRRCLETMSSAAETAQAQDPVPVRAVRLLHAIPANVIQPRRLPARDETITQLCRGVTGSAERARYAATSAVTDAPWSTSLTAESFRQAAASATIISRNCAILQQTLAGCVNQYSPTLSRRLRASAEIAIRAEHAWLRAARAWYYIRTDAEAGVTPAAAEIADLALWTGRLAYADPDWTPALGADHDARQPRTLVPAPGDLVHIAGAVHQATLTMTALAAADYDQITAAQQTGRLLVPMIEPATTPDGSAQLATTFRRAPSRVVRSLLTTYRSAGVAVARAAAAISDITVVVSASQAVPSAAIGVAAPDGARSRELAMMLAPAATAAAAADDQMPGPVERFLHELGVTRHDLLVRGVALDEAVSQLIDEAADDTASERWHAAAKQLTVSRDVAQMADHVLARDNRYAAVANGLRSTTRQSRRSQAEHDSMQAEP